MALADRIGQVFGEWTVIDVAPYKGNAPHLWCRCSCGREQIVTVGNLTVGRTRRCDRCRVRAMAEAAMDRLIPKMFCRCGAIKSPGTKSCRACGHKGTAAAALAAPSKKFPWKLREVAEHAGVTKQAVSLYVAQHGVKAAERFYGYSRPPR